MTQLLHALKDLPRTLLKLLLVAGGAVLGLVALAVGMLLALGLVLWALLRGRRPEKVQVFRWRGMPRGAARPPAEVVDIEAREVRTEPGPHRADAANARLER